MNKYRRLDPIDRDLADELLNSEDPRSKTEAILRVALFDPDEEWVTSRALNLLKHPDPSVRSVAATALGHVARIHRSIDVDSVVPALRSLLNNPATRGGAEDALDDISMYVGTNNKG